MSLKNIYIKNFRNIDKINLKFSESLNIFVGKNGQGKTNIIEAIHLILENESFRFGDFRHFIKNGEKTAYLLSLFEDNHQDFKIKYLIEGNRKKVLVNEKSKEQFKNFIPSVVLFSPESLGIIKESAELRRNLLDDAIKSIYKSQLNIISDFRKCLKTRNRLLKTISEQTHPHIEEMSVLASLNEIYLKLATDLTCARLSLLKSLKPHINDILHKISADPSIIFDFEYKISDKNMNFEDYESIYKNMQKRMSELQKSEYVLGSSLVGPQKHDVIFLYNGNDSRIFCSQGQQRSIILAYKMAQVVYHQQVNETYPVLLLDDVLSELDQIKQEALIKYLNEVKTQTFLTTTDVEVLAKLNIDMNFKFSIENGKIDGINS